MLTFSVALKGESDTDNVLMDGANFQVGNLGWMVGGEFEGTANRVNYGLAHAWPKR